MTMAPFLSADFLGGMLTQAVDSARAPLLFGVDTLCRAPGLWEEAALRSGTPLPLFEGIPLAGVRADEGHMALVVLYVVLFLGMVAFLRLQGKRILPMLFLYFFGRGRTRDDLLEDLRQEYGNVWITLLVGYSSVAMGGAFAAEDGFEWRTAVVVCLVLLLFQAAVSLLVVFLGWVFNAPRCASEACLANCAGNAVTALLLSPLMLSLFFVRESSVPLLFSVILIFLFLCLILKWIRLCGILFEFKVSVFYMILYLCTLEITPLLVAYKLLG